MNNRTLGFIIGGSPSTGSSLLRQILNRHSRINCAPETHLFCKKDLYKDWESNKSKLLKKSFLGLKSKSILPFVGLQTDEISSFQKKLCSQLIQQSNTFEEFVGLFFHQFFELKDSELWAEKTPCNANSFIDFLEVFPNGKVIHIVRNPLDTIASLMARSYTATKGTFRYLYNTSNALEAVGHERYFELLYEDLVLETESTIQALLQFLDLDFEAAVLQQAQQEGSSAVTQLSGWNYDETAAIGKNSVGRFQQLSAEDQSRINQAINQLRRKESTIKFRDINEIVEHLGYPEVLNDEVHYSKSDFAKEKRRVVTSGTPFHFFNFPIELKE